MHIVTPAYFVGQSYKAQPRFRDWVNGLYLLIKGATTSLSQQTRFKVYYTTKGRQGCLNPNTISKHGPKFSPNRKKLDTPEGELSSDIPHFHSRLHTHTLLTPQDLSFKRKPNKSISSQHYFISSSEVFKDDVEGTPSLQGLVQGECLCDASSWCRMCPQVNVTK